MRKVKEYLERGMLANTPERQSLSLPVKRLLSHWNRLSLKDGVLCRNVQDSQTLEVLQQIVIPANQAQPVWETYHQQAGHQQVRKIVVPVEEEFLLAPNGEDGGYLDPSLPTLHTARPDHKVKHPLSPSYPRHQCTL